MEIETVTGAPAEGEGVEETSGAGPRRAIGLADVLCVGPIALSIIYGYAGIPISPALIGSHPVLLSALRGTEPAMITTGAFVRIGQVPLWQALLAPVIVLMWVDPFLYWAGRRYGRQLLDYLAKQDPKTRRRIARGERVFARWGPWTIAFGSFIPVPSALFYLAAGETRMKLVIFFAADIFGTMLWIGFHVALGWAIGQRAVDVAQAISRYGLWLTIALVVIVVAVSFRRAWQATATESP